MTHIIVGTSDGYSIYTRRTAPDFCNSFKKIFSKFLVFHAHAEYCRCHKKPACNHETLNNRPHAEPVWQSAEQRHR